MVGPMPTVRRQAGGLARVKKRGRGSLGLSLMDKRLLSDETLLGGSAPQLLVIKVLTNKSFRSVLDKLQGDRYGQCQKLRLPQTLEAIAEKDSMVPVTSTAVLIPFGNPHT